MSFQTARQHFKNEELLLKVSRSVDRNNWNESRYEAYLDELCGNRDYQKEAIRTALRFLLGKQYTDLKSLAKENYEINPVLEQRFGTWDNMLRHLSFPDKLSGTLDLATGTGKSYVMYALAAILLSEGIVNKVLVLCPSTTIESGLTSKFLELASDTNLRNLLPNDAIINTPHIINATESITRGCICIENYHAVLKHVGSSIRDSLSQEGGSVLVLNDETHHVANDTVSKVKKWREFLADNNFNFKYIIGVSGTCYIGDEYFADVIYRYSLKQAMADRYVKKVQYISEMPQTNDPDEKWQLIYNRHSENSQRLKRRNLIPLTIIVTPTISRCIDVAEDLKNYLIEVEHISAKDASEKVLVVYNEADDIPRLKYVDDPNSKVEWIVSVSMLNEGWDVKRVFQIVPHEERAFNSKLLIAQVLGRGLRIPSNWHGDQPEVTIFNHDSWATSIKHLVNEVLEIDKKVTVGVISDSIYHFDLKSIKYELQTTSIRKPMTGEYTLFAKGYIDIPAEPPVEDINIEFEKADTGARLNWKTQIQHKTYSSREIAIAMYRRLEEAQDPDDPDIRMRTIYTDKFTIEVLDEIVKKSLHRCKMNVATESVKQKFLQSLGTLWRKESEYVRYSPIVDRFCTVKTSERKHDSVCAAELKTMKTLFYTDLTLSYIEDEQREFFNEIIEPGSGYKCVSIKNRYDFKTPLYAVIADSENERKFINYLSQPENVIQYESWIKSTAIQFYEINYAWKKGEATKRGKFSPDFFIKAGDKILVIEIKGDEELKETSEENKKKYEYADSHFKLINKYLAESESAIRYKLNFLTPKNFGAYF
ncbi:MAG: DEAD/DEAH box helicase family protein, partial [Bacillota bacterium]